MAAAQALSCSALLLYSAVRARSALLYSAVRTRSALLYSALQLVIMLHINSNDHRTQKVGAVYQGNPRQTGNDHNSQLAEMAHTLL